MFTGLIQSLGEVREKRSFGREARFSIRPRKSLQNPELGESISVNGVCLTVESFSGDNFSAYASEETLRTSTLGALVPGSLVNLEQALTLQTRLGGHMVSGHVDCVARVESSRKSGDSTFFRLTFPAGFGGQVVPKGSITLDGVSLTVNACGEDFLEVNIIPETVSATIISEWRSGRPVNMETDLVAKYVERLLFLRKENSQTSNPGRGISEDFLRQNGFCL